MSGFPLVDFESPVIQVKDWLWMFPSENRDQGNVAWWLNCKPEPVLIDCPEMSSEVINDLRKLSKGNVPKILLTNRRSHGKVSKLIQEFGWSALVQEQEAYLLPGLNTLESFENEFVTSSKIKLLWTPGPTPGSCVVYAPAPWNVLFCGRLLTPVAKDRIASVRTKSTFHWTMQQKSLLKLSSWIPSDCTPSLACGEKSHLLGKEKLLSWDAWH